MEGVELHKSLGKLFETSWFGFKRPRIKQLLNDNHFLKVSYIPLQTADRWLKLVNPEFEYHKQQ